MEYDLLSVIAFALVLSILLWYHRKRVVVQKIVFPFLYFVMYKTKMGLRWMNSLAVRLPRTIHVVSIIGIIIGFGGMAFIVYAIVGNTIQLFTQPNVAAGIQLVLPVRAPGIFFAPFDYWIIGILIIASVHEFMHGVVARRYGIPVKSSGFAFLCFLLPIVPAAFVEPDEKVLAKKKLHQQLGVFAAGPFANVLSAGIVALILLFAVQPVIGDWIAPEGVVFASVDADGPAARAGLQASELLKTADGVRIVSLDDLTEVMTTKKPGDVLSILTNASTYALVLGTKPDSSEKPYLGVQLQPLEGVRSEIKQAYGSWTVTVLLWFSKLLVWLFLLSLGIGLFNLLPLGPIDGGQMFRTVMAHYFPNHGLFVWKFVSFALLGVILLNFIVPFVR